MSDTDLWLASQLRPEAPRLLIGSGALILASFVNFRTGAQLRRAIEAGPGEGQSALTRSLLLFGAGAAAGCIRTFVFDSTAERLRASLAAKVFAAHLRAEPDAAKTSEGSSSVSAAMDSDVAACAEIVPKLQNVVRYLSSVLGGTAAMFRASWKLSVAVWPLLAVGALHGARAGARQAGASAKRLAAAREEATGFAEERLRHAALVRWFSRAEAEAATFREHCEACVEIAAKGARNRGMAHMVLDFVSKGLLLGLCHMGSRLVQRGDLTAGELTSFFFHASFLGLGFYGLVTVMPEVAVARSAACRLAATTAAQEATLADARPAKTGSAPTPSLRFQGVSFAYPSGKQVLDGFSLEIPAGSTCALVGPSGCGKSTLVSLLLRDYDAFEGKVLINGHDVRDYPRHELRSKLAVAPQQAALLSGTIFQSIAFGIPGAAPDPSRVVAAASAACAHSFVSTRPGGYEAPVGPGGQLLSGGERQRVAAARALARGAPVLVLDEPTAALDSATAAAVAKALLAPRADRPTTLVVTHSLALIRQCDLIAVMSKTGNVEQQGSFSELISDAGGAFADIMKAGKLEDDEVA